MKKYIALAVIFGLIGILFYSCGICDSNLKYISKKIDLNIESCKVEKEKDTHGGFLGDGEYFAKIKCNKEKKLDSKWKELPLSTELNTVMDMISCDNKSCKNVYKRYNIPKIKNGYYYFIDRHSDSKDKYNFDDINNRSSYNFSLAIYDIDTNIIYYYELDT